MVARAHGAENTYFDELSTTRSFFGCPLRSRRIGNKLISVPKTEKLVYPTINARKLPCGGRVGEVYWDATSPLAGPGHVTSIITIPIDFLRVKSLGFVRSYVRSDNRPQEPESLELGPARIKTTKLISGYLSTTIPLRYKA